jgi:hypothetical protein
MGHSKDQRGKKVLRSRPQLSPKSVELSTGSIVPPAAEVDLLDHPDLPPLLRELVLEGRVQLAGKSSVLLTRPPRLPSGAPMTVSQALEEQRSGD